MAQGVDWIFTLFPSFKDANDTSTTSTKAGNSWISRFAIAIDALSSMVFDQSPQLGEYDVPFSPPQVVKVDVSFWHLFCNKH